MGLKEHHFRLFHPPIYLIGKFFPKFIFLTNASPAGFCCSFRLLKRLVSPTSTKDSDTILISLPMISNIFFSHWYLFYQLFYQSYNFRKTYISGFIVLQKHSNFHSCRYCSFFVCNAMLRSFNQVLRPHLSTKGLLFLRFYFESNKDIFFIFLEFRTVNLCSC